jgi:DNA-binding FadR family transcriptional regulator
LSLADRAFDQLAHEIMSGAYQPSSQLPPERTLVELLHVNRQVVREALKRLEQVGLVKIAQGAGTTVLDFKRTGGLALADLLAENAQASEIGLWRAALQVRNLIAADSARLCAQHGAADLKRQLVELTAKMLAIGDGPELFALDLQFWERVVDGSQNLFYRLAYNSLIRAYLAPGSVELCTALGVHEVKSSGYRVPLAKAISKGNARAAEASAKKTMERVFEYLPDSRATARSESLSASSRSAGKKRARARKS